MYAVMDTFQSVRDFSNYLGLSRSLESPVSEIPGKAFYRGNRSSRGAPGSTGVRAVLSTIPISE